MKIAIVHDWLVTYAGSERVLEQMLRLYPQADLFSVVDFMPEAQRSFLNNRPVHTSFIQKLPLAKRLFRHFLPLMPLAIEQFDLSGYDLILSSSHAVAKGVLTGPDQLHICYIHSPIRYAWDLQHQYLQQSGLGKGIKGWAAKWLLHRMRIWDSRTSNGVDAFIANSDYIARRVWKTYRREASVIYPPVDVQAYSLCEAKEDYYLTASRMVPYKMMDLIIDAFAQMPDKRLIVIGDGPDYGKLSRKAAKAKGNITLLGYVPHAQVKQYMQKARAFVYAAEEDFGITPLEAQACGTPVIAYGRGGLLETIRGLDHAQPTGLFFTEQSAAAIGQAVRMFEQEGGAISAAACRDNALQFAVERFRNELQTHIEALVQESGIHNRRRTD